MNNILPFRQTGLGGPRYIESLHDEQEQLIELKAYIARRQAVIESELSKYYGRKSR